MKTNKKMLTALMAPIVLGMGMTLTARAAAFGNKFADCPVKKTHDYESTSDQKNSGYTSGGYEITRISHTGDTYRTWLESSSGSNVSEKSSFSDVMDVAKLRYEGDVVDSEMKVHLNISTAPSNFWSVRVWGSWTPNYK